MPGTAKARNPAATRGSGFVKRICGRAGSMRTRPVTVSGCGCRLQDRDHAAHRVAHQDGRALADLGEEPVQQALVCVDRGRAAKGAGPAVAGQVNGHHPAGLGEQRGNRRPVEQGAAESVHAHQQRAITGSTVVDVDTSARPGRPSHRPGPRAMDGLCEPDAVRRRRAGRARTTPRCRTSNPPAYVRSAFGPATWDC